MAASRFFSNVAVQTALSGNISSGATALTVNATTGFPALPYTLALDFGGAAEELVSVTASASTTLTVVRAYGGTSAQSHSIGAVVRHVYDATEAAAFRTHEGATAAIHGVTGTLVGTNDTQTLGNKTLTAPAITAPVITGGASLAGTFTGTPTYSGTPSFTGGALFQRAAAGNPALRASVTADTNDRLLAQADGTLVWGSGAATGDTTLSREGAKQLSTTDTLLRVYRGLTSDNALSVRVTGDTASRWNMVADGTMVWGPGGAASGDTNLYRQAADVLRTDDSLQVGGDLSAGDTTWTTYVPVVANQGTATYGRRVGWYKKIGKIVFVEIYLALSGAGTGSTQITITLPSTPFRDGDGVGTTRQYIGGHASGISPAGNAFQSGPVTAVVAAGGSGAVIDSIQDAVATTMWGQNFGATSVLTIQGWYREA